MDDRTSQGLKIGRKVGLIVSLIALFFVARWLWRVEPDTWSRLWHLDGWWLLCSIGLFQAWFILRYWAWEFISHRHGYSGQRHENLKMWAMSEMLRYIPGNIWSFAGRYRGVRQGGVARSGTIQALVLEALGLVAGSAIVSLWTFHAPLMWLAPAIVLATIFFGPRLISLVFRVVRRQPPETLSRVEAVTVVLFYIMVWVVFGLAHAALFHAMSSFLGSTTLWLATSVSVFSWFIGYVSLITPMGLGVREATLAKLLESQANIAVGVASVAAVVSRVWLVVAEIVFLGLVLLFAYRRRFSSS